MPRSVLEKFAAVQMIDVHRQPPTAKKLKQELPAQPPPKITANAPALLTPL
jgi:hypothetical protein